jgi:hypothetical protein
MRALTDRAQLLSEWDAATGQLLAAVEGLTDEQASRELPGGWSARDHLTHVTFWDEMRFFEISRIARGGYASFPATDEAEALNNQIAEHRRRLPLDQALDDLRFARSLVRDAIAGAPEGRLDPGLYDGIGLLGGAEHAREHAETITAWRKREGI